MRPRDSPGRRLAGAAAMALFAAGLAACSHVAGSTGSSSSSTAGTGATSSSSSTSSTTTTTLPPPASFRVGIRTLTFTDPTRPTIDYYTGAVISTDRVIETEIRYPTLATGAGPELEGAAPASQYGPFPVIVFAHGYALMPDTYQQLLDSWVGAGFVVVAPVFPVTGYYHWQAQGDGSAPEGDIVNQPEDVAFVIDQLAAGGAGSLGRIMRLGDLALAGQSDGGTTVAGLEFFTHYRGALDTMAVQPRAVAMLSAGLYGSDSGTYADPSPAPPILDVQSDADTCNVTGVASVLYDDVAPGTPAHFFLTLDGADHLGPYEDEYPWAPIVRQVTTAFFELELGSPLGHAVTAAQLMAAGTVSGQSQTSDSASINLPLTEVDPDGCGLSQPGPSPPTGTP